MPNLAERNKNEIEFIEQIFRASSSMLSKIPNIRSRQETAIKRVTELGFPQKSSEDWKYYDSQPILENFFTLDICEINKLDKEIIRKHKFPECSENLLVTVNGYFSKELSSTSLTNQNISIIDFNDPDQLKKHPTEEEIINQHFAYKINQEESFFKACNTALMSNGFLLSVPDDTEIEETIQILHFSNESCFNQTRSLIYLGKNAKLKIIVSYIGLANSHFVNNAVVELILSEGAHFKLDKIQDDTQQGILLYDLYARLMKNSSFEYNSLDLKANHSRDNIKVDLLEPGADADLAGFYILNKDRKAHNIIKVNHLVPNCTSNQLYKGIISDSARAEFNGEINVSEGANGTNATQLNKNLLLSHNAHIDSRPQLSILADDVKCSHGSTVGELDEDEIFYLLSRGIKKDDALAMLTLSFCEEIIQKVTIDSAKQHIRNLTLENLDTKIHTANTVHKLK
ncbi:MAG: Fe-S cluster assembly protein SufD [Candidatus Melainabacteria bacterium]|nr:Fe-S cluster assembly protein SufD [Candidatus Melainabacteria bacterium]